MGISKMLNEIPFASGNNGKYQVANNRIKLIIMTNDQTIDGNNTNTRSLFVL